MRLIILLAFVLLARTAVAGADQPWLESEVGGGRVPGLALVFGVIGAALLGIRTLSEGSSIGNALFAGFMGWVAGLVIGFPVSCIFR